MVQGALAPRPNPSCSYGEKSPICSARAYSLELQAGFLSVLVIILAVVIGLLTGTPDELSVPIGIVGGFSLQRYWEHWNAKTRRKLATGTSLRVRYKPYGPEKLRYGTLKLKKRGALVLGGRPGQVWFTTEMALHQEKLVLAPCAFANDIRGDLRYTTSAVAEAIRHRLDTGSRRMIYAPSSKHDTAGEAPPDITISPSDRSFPSTSQTTENKAGGSASSSSCTRRGFWPMSWKSWTKAADSDTSTPGLVEVLGRRRTGPPVIEPRLGHFQHSARHLRGKPFGSHGPDHLEASFGDTTTTTTQPSHR